MYKLLILLICILSVLSCKRNWGAETSDSNSTNDPTNNQQESYIIQADAQDFVEGEELQLLRNSNASDLSASEPRTLVYLRLTEDQVTEHIKPHMLDGYIILSASPKDISFTPTNSIQGFSLVPKVFVKLEPINKYTMFPKTYRVVDGNRVPINQDIENSIQRPVVYSRNGGDLLFHPQVQIDFKRHASHFFVAPGRKQVLIESNDPLTRHLAVMDEITSRLDAYENLSASRKLAVQQNIAQILHSRVQSADADYITDLRNEKAIVGFLFSRMVERTWRYELDGDILVAKTDLLVGNFKENATEDIVAEEVMLISKEGRFDLLKGEQIGDDVVLLSEPIKTRGKNSSWGPVRAYMDKKLNSNGQLTEESVVEVVGQLNFKFRSDPSKHTRLKHVDGLQVIKDDAFPFYSKGYASTNTGAPINDGVVGGDVPLANVGSVKLEDSILIMHDLSLGKTGWGIRLKKIENLQAIGRRTVDDYEVEILKARDRLGERVREIESTP